MFLFLGTVLYSATIFLRSNQAQLQEVRQQARELKLEIIEAPVDSSKE